MVRCGIKVRRLYISNMYDRSRWQLIVIPRAYDAFLAVRVTSRVQRECIRWLRPYHAYLVHNRWNKLIIESTYLYTDARKRNVFNFHYTTKIANFIIIRYRWHIKFWIANAEVKDKIRILFGGKNILPPSSSFSSSIERRSSRAASLDSEGAIWQLFALAVSFRIDRFSRPRLSPLSFRSSDRALAVYFLTIDIPRRSCVLHCECTRMRAVQSAASEDAATRRYLSICNTL